MATLAPGAPDGVLVNSFNGGDPLKIKDEIRNKGALPPRPAPTGDSWQTTGTFPYTDESGQPLYRTVRKEKAGKTKRFVAERFEAGRWVSNMGDVRRVLYRLPDVLTDPTKPVYLVEGERKADKLADWGLTATAVAFGCNGWRKAYADALAGRTVLILPDNDEQGRKFADNAKRDLEAAGSDVRVIALPGLPVAGDIIDWTGSASDLAALVEAKAEPSQSLGLQIIDAGDWHGQPVPDRKWIVPGWVPSNAVTLLAGAGGTGKSLFVHQWLSAIALGDEFLGMRGAQPVPVLYVNCEDEGDELHRRQFDIARAFNRQLSSYRGAVKIAARLGMDNPLGIIVSGGWAPRFS